ncbi:MAG: hypothetical protein AB3N13_03695 [Arenibacterium sp.]
MREFSHCLAFHASFGCAQWAQNGLKLPGNLTKALQGASIWYVLCIDFFQRSDRIHRPEQVLWTYLTNNSFGGGDCGDWGESYGNG